MSKLCVAENPWAFEADTPIGYCAWTRKYHANLNLNDGLAYAVGEKRQLATLPGALLLRIGIYNCKTAKEAQLEAEGYPRLKSSICLDSCNENPVTSTVAIYYKEGTKWFVAYCDFPSTLESVIFTTNKCQLANSSRKTWLEGVPEEETILENMLKLAKERESVVPVLTEKSVDLRVGPSAKQQYAFHPHAVALYGGKKHGREIAELSADYIYEGRKHLEEKWHYGTITGLTATDLDRMLLPSLNPKTVFMFLVSLSGSEERKCHAQTCASVPINTLGVVRCQKVS